MAPMYGRDTRTRFQGVYARHKCGCAVEQLPRSPTPAAVDAVCRCKPSFYGVAYDSKRRKTVKTKTLDKILEARSARRTLEQSIKAGTLPAPGGPLRFRDARTRFVQAAKDGIALNKWGKPYKRRAWEDLESALNQVPDDIARQRLTDVSRGDVQRLVDQLQARRKSGSRIRSVVNAIRSLYAWAQARELATHDPAARARLPAMGAKPRDRVATPAEVTRLLSVLELADAVPFALAAYGNLRHQEIRAIDWADISFNGKGAIVAAADEDARKPGGSWRIIPMVKPLRKILLRAWIARGRPKAGKVCPPRRGGANKSGLIALGHLQTRVHKDWIDRGLNPILLQELRHTFATWADHARVTPKVVSEIMGHKTADYQPGAAAITLQRYTHVLPGELERARDLLDAFLKDRAQGRAAAG